MKDERLVIEFLEHAGFAREREPVTFGVPFPHGVLQSPSSVAVTDGGQPIATAATPLARWEDGSIKWLLIDMQVSLAANEKKRIEILVHSPGSKFQESGEESQIGRLDIEGEAGNISIHCGEAELHLDPTSFMPFSRVHVGGSQIIESSRITLLDAEGKGWHPQVLDWRVEQRNPLRMVVAFEGAFASGSVVHPLRFKSRLHFYAGKGTVRVDFTAWNPRAGRHAGGVWDLGDPNSILFRNLRLELGVAAGSDHVGCYALDVGGQKQSVVGNLSIYQDSSGGENWRSHNHINKDEKIPVTFRGYRVLNGERVLQQGLRATPSVALQGDEVFAAASVKGFWQNFPKAFEASQNRIKIGLFPERFNDLFELQGGEQKTHTLYLHVGHGAADVGCLDWIHEPLLPSIDPEWYFKSGACPKLVSWNRAAEEDEGFQAYQQLIDVAVKGERSFFARREVIDEYGWRNFGDLYADHEAAFHEGPNEFVSHYNNQYDVVKGALVQFMRTGEASWHQLAVELADHVLDIDIYHTGEDRYQFNHGMFWHTDHYLDAATSSHRSSSRKHREWKDPRFVGGGPAYEHNYATGLLYLYWLTGEARFKEGVLELADYVVRGLEGPDTLVEAGLLAAKELRRALKAILNRVSEGGLTPYGFEGPGRATGNALNTLLDGFLVSEDRRYMDWAERLIKDCVSPEDDIEARDLLNAEYRWMYNIFLQALGRYLDIKRSSGRLDRSFWYGRSVLLKYAAWMLEHEYPYLEKPEILEFPNETWAAQDIRKADVLAHAALYSPEPLRSKLLSKSRFFFRISIDQVKDFPSRELTRPIAILMSNGMVHMDIISSLDFPEAVASRDLNYGPAGMETHTERRTRITPLAHLAKVLGNTSLKKELHSAKLRLQI
ncbi:hypothetical protein [Desulforhabdus sp. TSK]|uniref:RIFT barrel domain-containing protein n=1 Tax=Desulforhabdus sp. TSK TaxID=2925014 RepID=UPI001FC874C2|nr:hypothetical protein [Desulforhabdus sp. TSK]GKT07867.1 hypothetical protein DSTSK_11720 [Desulforhabdus sp. TSK]